MKEIYRTLLENIPNFRSFMTVDEMDESSRALAMRYPGVVRLSEIGKTREGSPLLCLKIGSGKKNALVFGLPHPNEPIGALMSEYLAEKLAGDEALREELGYTWYIVKAWDADGARRNEGWFKGPFTVTNYLRRFFRPAGFEQVDWTFPIDYKGIHFHKPLPETKAMMNLIDEIHPEFIYALHNAGFGGIYWYMTKPCPPLYEPLREVSRKYGLPLHLGEPESPTSKIYDKAIYSNMDITDICDYLERCAGMDEAVFASHIDTGDCSSGYAGRRYGSFTLLTELPYFYDSRIEDVSPSEMTRGDAVRMKYEEDRRMNQEIKSILALSKGLIAPDDPYLLAVENFASDNDFSARAAIRMIETDEDYKKAATVAEAFDNLLVSKFYKATVYGMLLRAYENAMDAEENSDAGKRKTLECGLARAKEAFERISAFLEEKLNYRTVPIRDLVSAQLESGLLVVEYLKMSENR